MAAHKLATDMVLSADRPALQSKLREIELQINGLVAKLWGLEKTELDSIQHALAMITRVPLAKKKPPHVEEAARQQRLAMGD